MGRTQTASGPFGRWFGGEGGIRDSSGGLLHPDKDGPPQPTQIRARWAQQGHPGAKMGSASGLVASPLPSQPPFPHQLYGIPNLRLDGTFESVSSR